VRSQAPQSDTRSTPHPSESESAKTAPNRWKLAGENFMVFSWNRGFAETMLMAFSLKHLDGEKSSPYVQLSLAKYRAV